MNRPIAIALAAGALLTAPNLASAQECRGGYQTLGNGVIVRCDSGPYYREADPYYAPAPQVYVAPRVYVERRPYYYRDRYPAYYGGYPSYYGSGYYGRDHGYYDRPYHYRHRNDCWPFRALAAAIPGVAPPAC